MAKKLVYIFLLLFIVLPAFGRYSDPCKKSTEGTDFWFGFMESRNYNVNHFVEITVTAREATTFDITIGNEETPFQSTFSVGANSSRQIEIPWDMVETLGSETVQNKGIHLVSQKPVNVYALNYDRNSADVAVIYPIESLGKEYFTMCYDPDIHERNDGSPGNGRNSQFLIVGVEDSTTVEIIPSRVTDQLVDAGDTIIVALNKGEVYQVQSENQVNLAGQGDLTRSYVKSDKPIALYSGSLATTVPSGNCCWDHLYEQIPPIHSWGREYYAVPLKSREQDRYRIMAADDNTTVQITNRAPFTLNRGEIEEIILYHDEPSRIFADKPILVAQYSQSRDVDPFFTGGNGDPFMIILSSVTQSKNDVTFVAYDSEVIQNYYVNIISLTSEINNLRYNNNPINNQFSPFPDSDYSYAQMVVPPGTHRIYNTNPDRGFLAYVYGYGGVESYGYGVGFNLDLVLDLGESIDFNGDTLLLCYGESITLDAGPYFDTYYWKNTGDTTQTLSVTEGGQYHVKTTTVDGCLLEDSIYVYLSHPKTELDIQYDEGCSPYAVLLEAEDGFEGYLWLNENDDSISTQKDIIADRTGEYRINAFDEFGCPARDTMELVVFPVPKLEISGTPLNCGSKASALEVSISDAPEAVWNYDKSYTWSANSSMVSFSNSSHTQTDISTSDWGTFEVYYQITTTDACLASDTFVITFHPTPTSDFIFEDDAKCEGYSKKLIYEGQSTDDAIFYWDLDGCHFVDTLGDQIYNVSVGAFLERQPYIKLVINDKECWSDTTIKPLGAKPNFKMTADNLRGCDSLSPVFNCELLTDDVVEYLWTFGDGTSQAVPNPIKHYSDTGFYDVALLITNPVTQCKNGFTYEDMVKVFPTPSAHITVDASVCYPDSASLTYTHSIDSSLCAWDFEGAHQSGDGNDSIVMILDDPLTKAILVVDEYGCVSTPYEVELKRKPHFDFSIDNPEGCQPYSTPIYANPGDDNLEFTWLTDTLPYPTGETANYLFPDSGRMDVILTALSLETGCSDTLLKTDWIWVHPKPKAEFEVDYPVALLEHATITYTNLSVLHDFSFWEFGDGSTSGEENPQHTFTDLGEYNSQLFVQSTFGCEDTTEFLIKILPFTVFTPTAFRPDSEIPENRTFMPVGLGADASRFNLQIFDRWGQIVFESNSPEHPWDGKTKNGNPAPMGNYVWISNYYDIQGFEHNQKGQVFLVR